MPTQKEQLKQYLVVINPSDDISDDVKKFKEEFRQKFGEAKYLNLWPHITLSLFSGSEELELQLNENLSSYAQKKKSFTVQIDNFDCFKRSGVIYLQPEIEIISELQREIPEIVKQEIGFEKKRVLIATHPHITIARSKVSEQFLKAWDYFQSVNYHKTFVVGQIHVYKRELKNHAPWTPCFKVDFRG